uniref:Uncharacterized protein n=1 Tax=Romanomermis culicivorax TaxID=13658 RepID=A0A915KPN3_ROMCU
MPTKKIFDGHALGEAVVSPDPNGAAAGEQEEEELEMRPCHTPLLERRKFSKMTSAGDVDQATKKDMDELKKELTIHIALFCDEHMLPLEELCRKLQTNVEKSELFMHFVINKKQYLFFANMDTKFYSGG